MELTYFLFDVNLAVASYLPVHLAEVMRQMGTNKNIEQDGIYQPAADLYKCNLYEIIIDFLNPIIFFIIYHKNKDFFCFLSPQKRYSFYLKMVLFY